MTNPVSFSSFTNIPDEDFSLRSSPSANPEGAPVERKGREALSFEQSSTEMQLRDQVMVQKRQELARAVYSRVEYLITPLEHLTRDELPVLLRTDDLSHLPVLHEVRNTLACPPKVREDGKGVEDLPQEEKDREKENIRGKHNKLIRYADKSVKVTGDEFIKEQEKLQSIKNLSRDDIKRFDKVRDRLVQGLDQALVDMLKKAKSDLSGALPTPQRQTYKEGKKDKKGEKDKAGLIDCITTLAEFRFSMLDVVLDIPGTSTEHLEHIFEEMMLDVNEGTTTIQAMQEKMAEIVPDELPGLWGRLKAGYDVQLLIHHAYSDAERLPDKYKESIFELGRKCSFLLKAVYQAYAHANGEVDSIVVVTKATPVEMQRRIVAQSRQASQPKKGIRDLPWLEQFVGERKRMLDAVRQKYNGILLIMNEDFHDSQSLPAKQKSREAMLRYAGEMKRIARGFDELRMHGEYAFGVKDAGNGDVGTRLLSDCQCFAFLARMMGVVARNYSGYLKPVSVTQEIKGEKIPPTQEEFQQKLGSGDKAKDEQGRISTQEGQSTAVTGVSRFREFRPFREINDELTSLAQQAAALKSQGEAKARTYDFKEAVSLFQQAAEIHQNAVAVMKRDGRSELGKHSQEKFGLQADKCLELKASCENFDFQGELDAITKTAVSRMSEAKTEVHFFNSAMSSYQETDSLQKALSGFEKSADAYQKAITLMEKNGKSEVGEHSLEKLKLKQEACRAFHTLYENFGKDEDSRFPSEEESMTLLDEGRLTVNKTDDKKGLKGHTVIRPPFEQNGEQIELPWVSLHTHSRNGRMYAAHFKLPRHIPYGGEYVEWSLNSQDVEEDEKKKGDAIKRPPVSIEAAMAIEASVGGPVSSASGSPTLSFKQSSSRQSLPFLSHQNTLEKVPE